MYITYIVQRRNVFKMSFFKARVLIRSVIRENLRDCLGKCFYNRWMCVYQTPLL